jgi:hypothetical protein
MGGRACALRVEEGVAPHKLAARREALSQVRRRGGDVAVGCCDVDAGPGVLRLEAGSSAGQIKARLQELVRHSQARRFYLCFTGVGGVERQEGVAGRKLTRMASVVARRLAGGGCVEVGPQGQGGASAAPLSWHGAGGGGGRTGQGDSSSSKGIGELEP